MQLQHAMLLTNVLLESIAANLFAREKDVYEKIFKNLPKIKKGKK